MVHVFANYETTSALRNWWSHHFASDAETEAGWCDLPRWCWERHANAGHEHGGLELVGHQGVHDRAVAVALRVVLQALHGAAPGRVAALPAAHAPAGEALEVPLRTDSGRVIGEAHEAEATARTLR